MVAHQFDSVGQPWLHSHVVVGALAAHPTIGEDQAAMVRDITQGGQGVAASVAAVACSIGGGAGAGRWRAGSARRPR
jgi:hypothetical protein